MPIHPHVPVAALLLASLPAQSTPFVALERTPFAAPVPAVAYILPIDVDGDGRTDLLAADTSGPIRHYRNVAPGQFVLHGTIAAFLDRDAVHGDLDGDGDLDVVTGSQLLRNDGSGHLLVEPLVLGAFLFSYHRLADCDGDGDLDLLGISSGIRLFVNNGLGQFTEGTATAFAASGNYVGSFTVLDADRDGDLDLGVLPPFFGFGPPILFRNDGTAHFTREVLSGPPLSAFGSHIDSIDLDRDGDIDLIAGAPLSELSLLVNDGLGHFVGVASTGLPREGFFKPFYHWEDWDQDGIGELVGPTGYWRNTGNYQYASVPFPPRQRITTPPVTVADLDGDLDLDFVAPDAVPMVLMNTPQGLVHAATRGLAAPTAPGARLRDVRSHGGTSASTTLLVDDGADTVCFTDEFDPANPLPRDQRAYRRRTFPRPFSATDACFVDRGSFARDSVVACTASGPLWFEVQGNGHVEFQGFFPPGVGTPTEVAAGDLDGQLGDELVFGDPAIEGPVLVDPAAVPPVVTVLALPPAAAHPAPLREFVLLADLDGDGDRDLVHELRVIRNDGQGQWSVASDFAAHVPPTATALQALDYDQDGDLDLLAYGGTGPLALLANEGPTFRDVTLGHVPPAAWFGSNQVTVGDVDADGDPDLLLARSSGSDLLRNDGGVFVRVTAVGPAGALVDADHDGRPDLFAGTAMLTNVGANLHAPRLATPGGEWLVQVRTWRSGSYATLALVAFGRQTTFQTVPGLGDLHVDLTTASVVPLPLLAGQAEYSLQVPPSPVLVGVELVGQGLVFDAERTMLTNALFDTVR